MFSNSNIAKILIFVIKQDERFVAQSDVIFFVTWLALDSPIMHSYFKTCQSNHFKPHCFVWWCYFSTSVLKMYLMTKLSIFWKCRGCKGIWSNYWAKSKINIICVKWLYMYLWQVYKCTWLTWFVGLLKLSTSL